MIHQEWQRRGLGRFLLMYRLKEINKAGGVQIVRAAAPLAVASFLEKQGFKPAGNGEMAMKLTVCP